MRISPADLAAEYERAHAAWPFIDDAEKTFRLPPMALYAVGSRETNLTDELGDYGFRGGKSGPLPGGAWAAGVFQLDAGSHVIPLGFTGNVQMQAHVAGQMLDALISHYATVFPRLSSATALCAAFEAYNAGQGTADYNLEHGLSLDTGTANGDYSADVYARMLWLQTHYPARRPAQPYLEDDDMMLLIREEPQNVVWIVRPDFSGKRLLHSEQAVKLLMKTGAYVMLGSDFPHPDLDSIPAIP